MRVESVVLRCRTMSLLAAPLLFFSAAAFAIDPPELIDATEVVEAQMEIATEGPTLEETRARQQILHKELIDELPDVALDSTLVIELTPEEIQALAQPENTLPLRVGLVKPVLPNVQIAGLNRDRTDKQAGRDVPGEVSRTPDGAVVWALPIMSPQAVAIRVHVENLSLPNGAELYFYSRSGEAYGPYTNFGPDGTGEFWTPSVFGAEGILQLRVPAGGDLRQVSLDVTEVGHIGPGFLGITGDSNTASFCQYNAACIENTNCVNESAVNGAELADAKMLWVQGCCIYTCSGALIADSDSGTQIPYFMTANHCLSGSSTNLEAFFQYSVSCGTSTCVGTFVDPPVSTKTVGGALKATNNTSDFTLLQLSQPAPSGSVFLGWTTTAVANTNGATLHRVSHPSGAPQAYSRHSVDTSAPTCSSWPRGNWIYSRDTLGGIEGGSSGSAVVNASGQFVGQLSGTCGFNPSASCQSGPGEANATVDGAFAAYFSQVSPFLSGGGGGCSPAGASCTTNAECCSNSCKGKPGAKKCK